MTKTPEEVFLAGFEAGWSASGEGCNSSIILDNRYGPDYLENARRMALGEFFSDKPELTTQIDRPFSVDETFRGTDVVAVLQEVTPGDARPNGDEVLAALQALEFCECRGFGTITSPEGFRLAVLPRAEGPWGGPFTCGECGKPRKSR